jgi:hypothetical protein
MPYTHDPIFPHHKVGVFRCCSTYVYLINSILQDTHPSVQARLYSASSLRPKFVPVVTQDNGTRRFAFLQGVLEGAKLQPYVHVAEVNVIHRGRPHQFYFFFKNHRYLPENQTVKAMTSDVSWHGDIIIMRGSHRGIGVVNMRQNDAKLADFALKKSVILIVFLDHYLIFIF